LRADVRALLASPLGFLIGMSLGALGGGGSILAVPALVYVAGQSASAATATSLVLVTITSIVGIIPHARAGRVRATEGCVIGLAGLGGAVAGSRLNAHVDDNVLLLAFSGVMIAAAALMLRSANQRRRGPRSVGAAIGPATATLSKHLTINTIGRVLVAGTGIGLLTGFFGVGGGFVIVPVLVLALGFAMPEAVGTSMVVIVINTLASLVVRLGDGGIDWGVVAPFAVSSVAGVLVGSRLAGRGDSSTLQRWFVALIVTVALYTAGRSLWALS
jgi:uncharacterized membrane protein YfcA